MNTVTQTMQFRQSLLKYAEKYGVTKAAIKYNVNRQYIYRWKRRYNGGIQSLANKSHRPHHHQNQHDGRVHFVTLAKKAEMDEYALKRIVGHKIDDLTERVYTRRTVEWLISELDKIP